jgi:hypothetical protein
MSMLDNLFGSHEDPRVKECVTARPALIHDFLDSRSTSLSEARKAFFNTLASKDQKPYCDGSQQTILTDSSPVPLTPEDLSKLMKTP